jgi:hypothetical protein
MNILIDEILRRVEGSKGLWVTVSASDEATGTCEVDSDTENVPRRVLLMQSPEAMLIPEDGCEAYVQRISPGVGQVVWFSKLKKIVVTASDKIQIKAQDTIELNGGTLGGLPQIDPLCTDLQAIGNTVNQLIIAFNALVTIYSAHVHAPLTVPPTAPGVPFAGTPLTVGIKTKLENTKITQ